MSIFRRVRCQLSGVCCTYVKNFYLLFFFSRCFYRFTTGNKRRTYFFVRFFRLLFSLSWSYMFIFIPLSVHSFFESEVYVSEMQDLNFLAMNFVSYEKCKQNKLYHRQSLTTFHTFSFWSSAKTTAPKVHVLSHVYTNCFISSCHKPCH